VFIEIKKSAVRHSADAGIIRLSGKNAKKNPAAVAGFSKIMKDYFAG